MRCHRGESRACGTSISIHATAIPVGCAMIRYFFAIATSQRLTNSEATEPHRDSILQKLAFQFHASRLLPRRHTVRPRTVALRSRDACEDRFLNGRKPSLVPGILMKRLGRAARLWSALAAARFRSCHAPAGRNLQGDPASTPSVRS